MRYAWDEGMGRLMLQDEPHVCRNYEKMNEWASPRASCHVPFPHQPADVIAKPRGSCVRGEFHFLVPSVALSFLSVVKVEVTR